MDRTRLLTLALGLSLALLLPAPALAAVGAVPWPLSGTPLVLAPDACAADPGCARFVQERDIARAGETPRQRAAREAGALRFRPAAAVTRKVDAVFARAFDFRSIEARLPRAMRDRLRRAADPRLLRRELRKRLAARRWSATDLGDLLALQTVGAWEQIQGRRMPAASASAFRDGLRDLMARTPRTARLSDAGRQLGGETSALMPIAFERLVAAFPARSRPGLRAELQPSLLDLIDTEFGIDLRSLRAVPTGFAPK
jgi:hypothetical protein